MNNQTIYSQKNLYPSHFHVFVKYIGFNWNSGKQIDMMMVWKKKTHTVLYILGIGILLYLNPLLYFFFLADCCRNWSSPCSKSRWEDKSYSLSFLQTEKSEKKPGQPYPMLELHTQYLFSVQEGHFWKSDY